MRVAALHRYPVKGLSPERLTRVELLPGGTFPADRAYAAENGPSGFDPAAPAWLPKTRFLCLARQEALARLVTRYDDDAATLSLGHGGEVQRFRLGDPDERASLGAFLADYLGARGPVRVLDAPGHSFSDLAEKVVSLINLASVAALEGIAGAALDPLRFRANLHVTGLPAWDEHKLLGADLAFASGARLRVFRRVQRCAAVDVDPLTGARDTNLVRALTRGLGHADLGVYAIVTAAGAIAEGDAVEAHKARHPARNPEPEAPVEAGQPSPSPRPRNPVAST